MRTARCLPLSLLLSFIHECILSDGTERERQQLKLFASAGGRQTPAAGSPLLSTDPEQVCGGGQVDNQCTVSSRCLQCWTCYIYHEDVVNLQIYVVLICISSLMKSTNQIFFLGIFKLCDIIQLSFIRRPVKSVCYTGDILQV